MYNDHSQICVGRNMLLKLAFVLPIHQTSCTGWIMHASGRARIKMLAADRTGSNFASNNCCSLRMHVAWLQKSWRLNTETCWHWSCEHLQYELLLLEYIFLPSLIGSTAVSLASTQPSWEGLGPSQTHVWQDMATSQDRLYIYIGKVVTSKPQNRIEFCVFQEIGQGFQRRRWEPSP